MSGARRPTRSRKPRETWRSDLETTRQTPKYLAADFGIEVDGLLKSEFVTIEGATNGARELKARFPMLQICITTPWRRRGPSSRLMATGKQSRPVRLLSTLPAFDQRMAVQDRMRRADRRGVNVGITVAV